MEMKKFDDELTGSEYADVESFTDLRVRFKIDRPIIVPQVFDGPFQRVAGRGLPFNALGIVALPIAVLPEGLRGLVQVDGLSGEVEMLISARYDELLKAAENGDTATDDLRAIAEQEVGQFCVAAPGPEGIEVRASWEAARGGSTLSGWRLIQDLRDEMRNRNIPQDHLFFGKEVEVVLSGVRADRVPYAEGLRQKPVRTSVRPDRGTPTGRFKTHPNCRSVLHEVDYASLEHRVLAHHQTEAMLAMFRRDDPRRRKFALTAVSIDLV